MPGEKIEKDDTTINSDTEKEAIFLDRNKILKEIEETLLLKDKNSIRKSLQNLKTKLSL